MTVLINRWLGDEFENCDIRCDFHRPGHGTVIEIWAGDCVIRICKSCLLAMVAEIDEAVLEAAVEQKGPQYALNADRNGRKELAAQHML